MASRPLTRAELIALVDHFAGSPYRERLEQIAAHDDEQREIISAQAREIARLAALLPAQPAKVSGSVSIVRSDDPPAKPLPTCVNCGSNFITPAPPAGAEVREAAEELHPYADWHEDDGTVLWYAVPVEEPPYCGEPLCSGWPKEWNAPCDTVTGAFIDGPYTGKVLMWQRLPELPPRAARRGGQKGGE